MKVENITNSNGNKVPNQFIITQDTHGIYSISFQSYETEICTYSNGVLHLQSNNWDYSNTTRKYFKQFVNKYTYFTYEDKKQFLKEIKNNDLIKVLDMKSKAHEVI